MIMSPDGKTLVTSGEYDGTVRFWDTATGVEVRAFRPALARARGADAEPGRRVPRVGLGRRQAPSPRLRDRSRPLDGEPGHELDEQHRLCARREKPWPRSAPR